MEHLKLTLLVFLLSACSFNPQHKISSFTGTVLIGQAYPSKDIVLFHPTSENNKRNSWPKKVNVIPLLPVKIKLSGRKGARFYKKINDIYVPEYEKMPVIHKSSCSDDNYRANKNYQYVQSEWFVDFFDRGFSDNCFREDAVAVYKVSEKLSFSFPAIAFSGNMNNVDVSYKNHGKKRVLSTKQLRQVEEYKKQFRKHYRQAYNIEYDENSSNIGTIPTVADARILLELTDNNTGQRLMVSFWEKITIAQHVYRVIIVDRIYNGKVLETIEFTRPQGVLG